jgi:hypothetical protein
VQELQGVTAEEDGWRGTEEESRGEEVRGGEERQGEERRGKEEEKRSEKTRRGEDRDIFLIYFLCN